MLIKASVFGANARVMLPDKMEDARQEPPALIIAASACSSSLVPLCSHGVLPSSTAHSSSSRLLRCYLRLAIRRGVLDGFSYIINSLARPAGRPRRANSSELCGSGGSTPEDALQGPVDASHAPNGSG